MSEAVSQKSDWTTVAFGDVVKKVTDKVDPEESGLERYVAGEHMDTDDLRIRRWGEIGDDYLGPAFHMRFKPGQVLYGSRRTYLRKVALADFEGITANTTYVLESKDPEILLPDLLPFLMQAKTFHEHSKRESKGSVNPYVNFSDLAWYEFALPPLEEQRRIAEVLQAWRANENAVRDAESSLELCKVSLLDEIFHPEDSRRVLSKITDDPAGDWIRLGDICNLQAGYAFKSAEYSESGDRLLRGSNVAVDATSWEPAETKFWPKDRREEFSDFILHEDDMVIAMDRPFIGSGFKVARLAASDLPALLLQRVGRFQVQSEEHKEVVWAFIHSRSFHVQLLAQQEGTDLPHISKAQIENAILPLDSLGNTESVELHTRLSDNLEFLRGRLDDLRDAARVNLEEALS